MAIKIRPNPAIPDHEVLRKIGGGAYGEVWLARGVTGALRAVKVVWREDFEDARTFEREFEGILKFEPMSRDHPALVNILHVGRSPDGVSFYYYVMEVGDDVTSRAGHQSRGIRAAHAAGGQPSGIRRAVGHQRLHRCGVAFGGSAGPPARAGSGPSRREAVQRDFCKRPGEAGGHRPCGGAWPADLCGHRGIRAAGGAGLGAGGRVQPRESAV